MAAPGPNRKPAPSQAHGRSILTLETAGLLIIGLLMLAITVIRAGRHIPWSAR